MSGYATLRALAEAAGVSEVTLRKHADYLAIEVLGYPPHVWAEIKARHSSYARSQRTPRPPSAHAMQGEGTTDGGGPSPLLLTEIEEGDV
jgi:hypothetical protein